MSTYAATFVFIINSTLSCPREFGHVTALCGRSEEKPLGERNIILDGFLDIYHVKIGLVTYEGTESSLGAFFVKKSEAKTTLQRLKYRTVKPYTDLCALNRAQ